MGTRTSRAVAHLLVVLAALVLIGSASCGAATRTEQRRGAASCAAGLNLRHRPATGPPVWIISAEGLSHLVDAGLPEALLRRDFNRPSALVLASTGTPDPLAPRAGRALLFESARALIGALRRRQVPASVRYLLLDLESWPLTPLGEQLSPIASLRAAVAAAHAQGKCVVFTPALDLMSKLAAPVPLPALFGLFDRQIVQPGAAISDVFEVQAQHTEGTRFASAFVPGAVAAARAAEPDHPVVVGLSTNPNGRQVTSADLLALYRLAARAGASGYWLNIAGRSPECPRCGTPQTQVAVAFLEALAGNPGKASTP